MPLISTWIDTLVVIGVLQRLSPSGFNWTAAVLIALMFFGMLIGALAGRSITMAPPTAFQAGNLVALACAAILFAGPTNPPLIAILVLLLGCSMGIVNGAWRIFFNLTMRSPHWTRGVAPVMIFALIIPWTPKVGFVVVVVPLIVQHIIGLITMRHPEQQPGNPA